MPYIKQEDRQWLLGVEDALEDAGVATAGEIQYLVALVIKEYLRDKELRYQTFNDVLGALAGAEAEFYREVLGPYEDMAIEKNGGISGYNDLFPTEDTEEKSKFTAGVKGSWKVSEDGEGAQWVVDSFNEVMES